MEKLEIEEHGQPTIPSSLECVPREGSMGIIRHVIHPLPHQQPDGKKKKGKKGEGNQNQNKPKPVKNADGGKKEKKKVKFPCKLC